MKKIYIKFVGFWQEFNPNNNFIINALRKSYEVILTDHPDYIISSCFSDEYLQYDCVRIFYTGENLCPDFNAFDYAIAYENMDFGDRYLRYPDYCIPEVYGDDYKRMLNKHLADDNALKDKKEFCSFVVSKGKGYVDSTRRDFFELLNQYKKVNSGGRFLNNIGQQGGVIDKLAFQQRHKFSISFENSSHAGYTTEKIVQAFAAKTVPIYWGDPLIGSVFNERAFINCHKFKCMEDVVKQVKHIDEDDMLYSSMIKEPALIQHVGLEENNIILQNFLFNIFEQNLKHAFRRDRVGYGRMHCDHLMLMKKIKGKKIIYKILRLMYKI